MPEITKGKLVIAFLVCSLGAFTMAQDEKSTETALNSSAQLKL